MNNNAQHFDQFIRDYAVLKAKLPRMFGIEAVNLFKANFDAEGFIAGEGRLQKWEPTKRVTGRKNADKNQTFASWYKSHQCKQKPSSCWCG